MHVDILSAVGDNYIYLISDAGCAAVVDPTAAAPPLAKTGELNLALELVLLTHHHFDHTGGSRELKRAGCTVVGPDDSRISPLDRPVKESDVVSLGDCKLQVISVPGHTSSHVAYYSAEHGVIFTGDTLFAAGCGRVFECTAAEMWNSLQRIRALPDETLVYCGHEYTLENLEFAANLEPNNPDVRKRLEEVRKKCRQGLPAVPSTLALEKATNPFLRVDTEAMRKAAGLPRGPAEDVFAEIRLRKDRW